MVIEKDEHAAAVRMLSHITASPTAFHVIANIKAELDGQDFTELKENEHWDISAGGRYYVTRNDSSVIAFICPEGDYKGFRIMASHSDSPAFKLKDNPGLNDHGYTRLNVEGYGGMLDAPWFDRPLSVAGRILIREKSGQIESRLVNIERSLLMLPSLAIHMNREANNGYKYNAQKDMLPIYACGENSGDIISLIAASAGVDAGSVLGHDLFVYVRDEAVFWGENQEFISSPRLDDQECVWCTLEGFLAAADSGSINPGYVPVYCVFDNEEVGSRTKQGAASTFLSDTLERINICTGRNREEFFMAASCSFMISADNAHALHPAHPDKADPENHTFMNGGIVLKFSARQSYTTDGVSGAVVKKICEDNSIPLQVFVNRSDIPGGSTLGNISNTKISMNTADIGLAQLAMHSPYESAGTKDVLALIRFSEAFYRS